MTIREALKGLTGYPIPVATLDYILTASDIDGAAEFSVAISQSAEYKRAEDPYSVTFQKPRTCHRAVCPTRLQRTTEHVSPTAQSRYF